MGFEAGGRRRFDGHARRWFRRRLIRTLPFLALCSFGHAAAVSAQDEQRTWSQLGPYDDSQNVYVRSLAIDPLTPATVYAGLVEDGSRLWGVYKSPDGGSTWNAMNSGMPSDFGVFALAIDPGSPTMLYAGLDGAGIGSSGGGLVLSRDGGQNWRRPANDGLSTSLAVHAVVIDPHTTGTIYAGTMGGGVFVSDDYGESWRPFGLTVSSVNALAITYPGGDTLAFPTLYAATDGGVFVMTDGMTWNPMNANLPDGFGADALAIDPSSRTTVYVALDNGDVFQSLNGGDWVRITSNLPNAQPIHAIAVDPTSSAVLYVATFGAGLYKTTNGGASWTLELDGGTADYYDHALAFDPVTPTTLYAATCNAGVWALR